ncbi:MAG TPA: hypothetical protein VI756_09200, partial [Blastocatellia bacterium]
SGHSVHQTPANPLSVETFSAVLSLTLRRGAYASGICPTLRCASDGSTVSVLPGGRGQTNDLG